jgi:hypothetical protein
MVAVDAVIIEVCLQQRKEEPAPAIAVEFGGFKREVSTYDPKIAVR